MRFNNHSLMRFAPRWSALLALFCLLVSGQAQAVQEHPAFPESEDELLRLEQQRPQFEKAWKAARSRHFNRARALSKDLYDYPLYADLEAEWLSYRPQPRKAEEALNFIALHPDTAASRKVAGAWARAMARKGLWRLFVEFSEPQEAKVEYQCGYYHYLYEQGQQEEALQAGEAIWLHGASRPKQCDKLFRLLSKHDRLTDAHLWDRFILALGEGQHSLASYLARKMEPGRKKTAEAAVAVRRNPARLARSKSFLDDSYENRDVVPILVKALRRKDLHQSMEQWRKYRDLHSYDSDVMDSVDLRLARSLYNDHDAETMAWLMDAEGVWDNDDLREIALRTAVRNQDWTQLEQLILSLPHSEQDSDRWLYWYARAIEQQGFAEESASIYGALAGERSYYGFLSADKVQAPYQLNLAQVDPGWTARASLGSFDELRRAREWMSLKELGKAQREWYLLLEQLDGPSLRAAAELALAWDMPGQAIRAMGRARYWDELDLRFPVAFESPISQSAKRSKISRTWVYGVTRQESAFATNARSHAGAMGLMQLMPATAKQVAQEIGTQYDRWRLLDPDVNIRFGTHYLSKLHRRFDQNRVLATAAYNAGPHRVKRWLNGLSQAVQHDVWVEQIPFSETRKYVQNVLSYAVIYGEILGESHAMIAESESIIGADKSVAGLAP